ncbi:hypothetical protein ACEWY4_020686 [Coilia grayii]|uniref:SCAN box domain-containing protein n=1 Tax=Coilia grayii TaxID=363190 RepID=A0ABD1J6U0_9TELE
MNQLREDLEEGRRTAGDRGQRQAEPGDNQRSDDEEPQHPAGGPPALEDQPAAPRMSAAPRTPAAPRMPPADPPGASPVAWTRAAVPKLEEGDDIEQYLTTFERLAGAYRWPRADWPVYLVPYLVGRARAAYVAMDIEEAMDYDKVKEAILMKYEINEEIYRERFREPDIRPGETPRELYHRLKDLYKKWIKPAGKTVEEVGEKIILEQYLRSLAPDVRIWVKEHNPATGQQAAEWVEAFLSARRGPKTFRFQRVSRPAAGVADVCVEVGGQAYRLMAGVVKGLSHPVVLGQDVLILPELVQASKPVSMVVTRAQAKERAAETPEQVVNKTFLDLMPYSNSEFDTPKRPKVLKTRSQRRREKLLGTVQRMPVEGVGPEVQGAGLWEIPSDFASLQKDDATLKDVFNKVSEIDGVKTGVSKGLTGECHFVRAGLLYHRSEDGMTGAERSGARAERSRAVPEPYWSQSEAERRCRGEGSQLLADVVMSPGWNAFAVTMTLLSPRHARGVVVRPNPAPYSFGSEDRKRPLEAEVDADPPSSVARAIHHSAIWSGRRGNLRGSICAVAAKEMVTERRARPLPDVSRVFSGTLEASSPAS